MIELDDVNSVEQAAEYLKLKPRKVLEIARAKKLAGIKEGRTWIFPRTALEAYVAAHTTTATQANPWGLTERGAANIRGRRTA